MSLTILGLSGALTHDPSAALYIDGKLVAALVVVALLVLGWLAHREENPRLPTGLAVGLVTVTALLVVVLVLRWSGWPAQRLSSCRKRRMSSSGTDSSPSVSYLGLTALTPLRWSIE